jgi:hypothetical protein
MRYHSVLENIQDEMERQALRKRQTIRRIENIMQEFTVDEIIPIKEEVKKCENSTSQNTITDSKVTETA